MRTAVVAALLLVETACGDATTSPSPVSTFSGPMAWTEVASRADLESRLADAKREHRPVVVETWAVWCHYCRNYDELIDGDSSLRRGFDQLVRLRINSTDESRDDVRQVLSIPPVVQPYLVFIDAEGRWSRATAMSGYSATTRAALVARLTDLGAIAR